MSIVNSSVDTQELAFTIVADYSTAPERVWQVWADPRRLERWWGPPTWPATVTEHDLVPGGRVDYFMTGPDGAHAPGWWRVTAVDAPRSLEFEDGFSDDDGDPDPQMPTTMTRVTVEGRPGGTRMTVTLSFASAAQMEQLVGMGMIEGMNEALGQVDAILAE